MRGVTGLFGPSGCGKTTVLRCVAGLQMLREGYLSIGGEVWQDGAAFRPPYQRSVGYVFQEASLFPHLSVRRNLLYGHRRAMRRGAEEVTRLRRRRRPARDGGPARPLAPAPVGRGTPAGGGRTRPARAAQAAAHGRAAGRARPPEQGRDPALPRGAAYRALDPDPLRQSRSRRGRAPGRPSRAARGRPRRRVRAPGGAAGRSGASGRASARRGGRAERDGHPLRRGVRAHDACDRRRQRSSRPASTAPRERRSGCASEPPTSAWRGRTRDRARSSMCCRPAWRPPSRRMRRR